MGAASDPVDTPPCPRAAFGIQSRNARTSARSWKFRAVTSTERPEAATPESKTPTNVPCSSSCAAIGERAGETPIPPNAACIVRVFK